MLAIITVDGANQIIHNFNWHTPSWDLFILLFWAVASIFYAFSAGRGRIISLLMSLYIAKLFVLQAPWLGNSVGQALPNTLSSIQQLVSFLIIFVILFVLLSRYAFRTSADGRHFTAIPFAIVFAVLQVGLLINTILSYLAVSGKTFSDLITLIFLSGPADFIWLVAPLVFLIILGRAVADPNEI
ncbi:MAG: hypothetical protein P4L74_01560 [Candidatus Doudnabacteria bacterium]|nr:hypothetical protein [Candidatus Doudnabacteria bacterium]